MGHFHVFLKGEFNFRLPFFCNKILRLNLFNKFFESYMRKIFKISGIFQGCPNNTQNTKSWK